MLVLSRKIGERIVIGDDVVVVVNRVAGNRVMLGIEAPQKVRIVRGELESVVRDFEQEAPTDVVGPLCPYELGDDLTVMSRIAR